MLIPAYTAQKQSHFTE